MKRFLNKNNLPKFEPSKIAAFDEINRKLNTNLFLIKKNYHAKTFFQNIISGPMINSKKFPCLKRNNRNEEEKSNLEHLESLAADSVDRRLDFVISKRIQAYKNVQMNLNRIYKIQSFQIRKISYPIQKKEQTGKERRMTITRISESKNAYHEFLFGNNETREKSQKIDILKLKELTEQMLRSNKTKNDDCSWINETSNIDRHTRKSVLSVSNRYDIELLKDTENAHDNNQCVKTKNKSVCFKKSMNNIY